MRFSPDLTRGAASRVYCPQLHLNIAKVLDVQKDQGVTTSSGAVTSTIDLDPWGGETARSSNQAFQPHRYTTYERDSDGGDEVRRYGNYWTRFSQPDPYDGSYDLTDPQSFNRYAYVQNDPVNFVDPSGPTRSGACSAEYSFSECGGRNGIYSGVFGDGYARYQAEYGHLPPHTVEDMRQYNERVGNAVAGNGFMTNAELTRDFLISYGHNPDGSLWTFFSISLNVGTGVYSSGARNGLAGIIDNGVGPPPIFGWSLGRLLRIGADRLAGNYANEQSTSYYIGSWVPDALAVVAGGGAARQGPELVIRGARIAPFGNATKHPIGRFPHYHRRVPNPGRPGESLPGQGIGRHRPWENSRHDTLWRHRF